MKSLNMFLGFLVAFLAITQPLQAEPPKVSVIIVVDTSSTLQNVAGAHEALRLLLHHVTRLAKRRATANATVTIVSLNDPRTLFRGTPKSLRRTGQTVLGRLGMVQNGCNATVAAFEQVRMNIELQRPERVEVYLLTSGIATGANCDGVVINLPHPFPDTLDLSFLKDAKFRAYWLHHLQMRPFLDVVNKANITDFQLYDEVSSNAVLEEGLD